LKVRELIEQLQQLERMHGDLPVVLKGRGMAFSVDRCHDPFPDVDDDRLPYFNGFCILIDREKFY
jgi:hypothetical protein